MSNLLVGTNGIPLYSKFYYGYIVDNDNYILNFKEGSGSELAANLNPGSYTFTDFAAEIQRALDDAGELGYTVTANRTARTITVAATGTFSLLVSSGTSISTGPFGLMGFTGSDRTSATTYTGNGQSGSEYRPQFWLQNYVSPEDWQQASSASVNVTATGRAEVVKFGTDKFSQFQVRYVTDFPQNSAIRTDVNALSSLRLFMQFITRRDPFEFMADETQASTFQVFTLESSPDSSTGTGYKISELYDQDLAGYFETPVLKFRLREA